MTDKAQPQQSQKNSSHWVKQLYYYTILGISILFIAIGIFTLVRATLVRYVFTSIDDYSYVNNQCDYVFKDGDQSNASEEDRKVCLDRAEEARVKQAKISFERDMLNGVLMVFVASVVLGLHVKYVKIRD